MNITVIPNSQSATIRHRGQLSWGRVSVECALGTHGVTSMKSEGDHKTPIGIFPLRRLFYRPDRIARPETGLPTTALSKGLGWCDDMNSPSYNRLIRRPCAWRHEKLWRDDELYDLVVVLGHNDAPPVPGLGSAIFLHVAGSGMAATEGCVAIPRPALLDVIKKCHVGDLLEVLQPPEM